MTIELDRVYSLGEAFSRDALRVNPRQTVDASALLRGNLTIDKPLVFEISQGRKRVDLVGTGYAGLVLVSDSFINVLSDAGFTGWTTYPVHVLGRVGDELVGYHGLSILGRCGPLDLYRGEKIIMAAPPGGTALPGWRGFHFDPSTWDGSDLFLPEGARLLFVVEAVKNALQKAGLSNLSLERITEIERAFP